MKRYVFILFCFAFTATSLSFTKNNRNITAEIFELTNAHESRPNPMQLQKKEEELKQKKLKMP